MLPATRRARGPGAAGARPGRRLPRRPVPLAPSRSLYLGLQPRRRPGQAGAGTAEVRGRHVFLVQPVAGRLPHPQVAVAGGEGEVGLAVRREGAGDPRRGHGVAATAATGRHVCFWLRGSHVFAQAQAHPARGGAWREEVGRRGRWEARGVAERDAEELGARGGRGGVRPTLWTVARWGPSPRALGKDARVGK